MKILNNKGTSLIELIISVLLISIVIIFMFQLLLEINNEQNNNVMAVDNQVNRAEIIRYIENDLNNHVLSSIIDNSTNNNLNITFNYNDSLKTIINGTKNNITITNTSNDKRLWNIEDGTLFVNKVNVESIKNTISNYYALYLNMEIHTANEKNMENNNNSIDDLSLTYIGKLSDYDPNITCLGYCCNHSC